MGQDVDPERVVAVAQVAVAGPEKQVGQERQRAVADAPKAGQVVAATAQTGTAAFGEVGAVAQGRHEPGDLGGVGAAVGVEHDDHVAGRGGEAADERVALAVAGLADQPGRGQHPADDAVRVVRRVPVDDDDLVHRRQRRQHLGEVARLVEGRDHDGDPGFTRAVAAGPHRRLLFLRPFPRARHQTSDKGKADLS
ncbi:hypothetical protein Psuf_021440 [Phytohabitans suffuscus]|uniref:Uncharacterized protein n=1 Tax=Phytohabitans suffuscus TaxID=624315 RepID=A0A6F8YFV9_9ACTN|nr:hypothetical protein Psuf_021440 [Phytohabitans suffuscus]